MKHGSTSLPSKGGRARHRLLFTIATVTIGIYLLFAVTAAIHMHNRVGLGGAPLFYDFSVFHQAGVMADTGHAADAYDDAQMMAAQHAAFPGSRLRLPWNYPPTFQLMLMPIGALPYVAAWLAWSFVIYGCYALFARRLAETSLQLELLLLAPGAAVNLFFGQNGILSAVLMGAGVLLLDERPILGGILLGMMAYKPQLAMLIPLVLLAGREFRAFAAAMLSQAMFMLLSAIVLGTGAWLAFLRKVTQPATVLSSSSSDWKAIPSIMTFAKTLGFDDRVGAVAHWTIAILASGLAVWAWHNSTNARYRLAILATAALLVTPYLRGYDLMLLVLTVGVTLSCARLTVWEKVIVLCAWLVPAQVMFMPMAVQFGALVSLSLLIVASRRIFFHSHAQVMLE